MKCLTVTIDDRVLFSGEIAEYQYGEGAESVSLTARFAPAPTLLSALQGMAKMNKPGGAPESNDSPQLPPRLAAVRDKDEQGDED